MTHVFRFFLRSAQGLSRNVAFCSLGWGSWVAIAGIPGVLPAMAQEAPAPIVRSSLLTPLPSLAPSPHFTARPTLAALPNPATSQNSAALSPDRTHNPLLAQAVPLLAQESQPKITLKVGVNQVYPFVFLQDDRTFGFSIDLWENLALEMGVETQFVPYESVADLLNGVRAGEVDLAIAGISVTAKRETEGLDFSYPMYHGGLQILTTIQALSPLDRLLSVLGGEATLVAVGQVLGSSLLVGFLVWLFEHKHNAAFPPDPMNGIGQGIWFAVVTLGTFGYGDVTPMGLPGRIVAVLWMAMSFFIVGDFIGAMSANHRMTTAINGIEDLYGHNVAVVRGTTAEGFMQQKPVNMVLQPNTEASLEALRQGQVLAIVLDYPTAHYLTQLDSSLVLAGNMLNQELYAIAVAEDQDELLEGINLALLRLHERDVWTDINRRWFQVQEKD
ncbi:MAG: transporter substrate-binding domain-containing protein [Prochlorothrix sp.]